MSPYEIELSKDVSSAINAMVDLSREHKVITYNCSDFSTQASAQACFNHCVSAGPGDIHKLDRDNNGVDCEALPLNWEYWE